MKSHTTATRIIAGVLPAMALFAIPAFAQELQTQTAPPPAPTAVAPAPAAPAPVAAAPSSGANQAAYEASLRAATGTTAAADAPAAREAPVRATTRTATRATPSRAAAAAPVAAAPVTEPAVPAAPIAAATAPAEPAVIPVPAAEATSATTAEQTSTVADAGGFPTWGWLIVGLAVLGALAGAVIALRRRREQEEWVGEDTYAEPIAAESAVSAVPAHDKPIAEHAEVVAPPADDIAAITDAAAPVAGRPWIELSLRPLRAGATDESALVDLELTLANAGELAAEDVRVSTFMLGDASDAPTQMDRLLAGANSATEVEAGAIGAGEGSRIDARLALPREGMEGATFNPVVVADVRYRLPGGGEGRTAAAFTVGVLDDTEEPTPLRLGGDIREDVAATLHGVPERV